MRCKLKRFLQNTKQQNLEPTINPLDYIDSEDLIASNLNASDEAEAYQDDWKDNRYEVVDNSALIDDMFSHYEKQKCKSQNT